MIITSIILFLALFESALACINIGILLIFVQKEKSNPNSKLTTPHVIAACTLWAMFYFVTH